MASADSSQPIADIERRPVQIALAVKKGMVADAGQHNCRNVSRVQFLIYLPRYFDR